MKSALITFRNKVKSYLGSVKVREFALVGNNRVILTTSAFKEFFKKPVEKPEDLKSKTHFNLSGHEYKDDKVSKLLVGYCLQRGFCEWPKEMIGKKEDGYKLIIINPKNKTGSTQLLGKNYEKALAAFNVVYENNPDNKIYILTDSKMNF